MTIPATAGQKTVLRLLQGTASDYDRIVDESTMGWDLRWKQWMLDRMHEPQSVLDLACGTGILTYLVHQQYPGTRVTGVDLQADYLEVARSRAVEFGLEQSVQFVHSAVEDFTRVEGAFDHIISSYLPKYADLPVLVRNLKRWSAPGARVLLHDFTHPTDPEVERVVQRHHERWLTRAFVRRPHWIPCFEGLYDVVRISTWDTDLAELLKTAGFDDVEVTALDYGCAAVVTATAPAV